MTWLNYVELQYLLASGYWLLSLRFEHKLVITRPNHQASIIPCFFSTKLSPPQEPSPKNLYLWPFPCPLKPKPLRTPSAQNASSRPPAAHLVAGSIGLAHQGVQGCEETPTDAQPQTSAAMSSPFWGVKGKQRS